jgi:hypothetical protein
MAKKQPVGKFHSSKLNAEILIFTRRNESVKDAILRVSKRHGVDISRVTRLP